MAKPHIKGWRLGEVEYTVQEKSRGPPRGGFRKVGESRERKGSFRADRCVWGGGTGFG